jgi:hypothetical protein
VLCRTEMPGIWSGLGLKNKAAYTLEPISASTRGRAAVLCRDKLLGRPLRVGTSVTPPTNHGHWRHRIMEASSVRVVAAIPNGTCFILCRNGLAHRALPL